MGFNKIEQAATRKGGKDNQHRSKEGFVPSTNKELKQYERNARDAEVRRAKEKAARKDVDRRVRKLPGRQREVIIALQQNEQVRVLKPQFFDALIATCKDNDMRPPAYCEYMQPREADGQFMFDMQAILSRMSWMQLQKLTDIGLGFPVPVASWVEAFRNVLQLVISAFDVRNYLSQKKETQQTEKIHDREALDEWPIPGRKRKSKDHETVKERSEMLVDHNNRKLRAMADDDEDEDEDETTSKKRRGADDDEDEDEDDEPPARKSKTKAKSKGRADADEEEEDDEDEEETKMKTKSKGKKTKAADSEPKAKRKAAPAAKLEPGSVIKKTSKTREGGGAKGELYNLVTKKGIKFKDLLAAAEEAELPVGKVKKWVPMMIKNGFLAIAE